MCGKGDLPRPVDQKKWDRNWPRIFSCKHCRDFALATCPYCGRRDKPKGKKQ